MSETTSRELVSGPLTLSVIGSGQQRRLRVAAPTAEGLQAFDGTAAEAASGAILEGPLSPANAAAVRATVPWLQPKPVGLHTSAGVGDRLARATPGHVRAFQTYGAGLVPVFAQQSAREMDRLGRTPQEVLDAATFGALQGGWDRQVGADADHLKSTHDIDRCLAAGFTSFTLDAGDTVNAVPAGFAGELSGVPWDAIEDDEASLLRRYAGDVQDPILRVSEPELRRAAYKYGAAIAYTVAMYRHLMANATYEVEVEIAVDETDDPTTIAEHVYIATELKRLGVAWNGFAPRYVGGFEKGVEYIGPTDVFAASLREHFAVASVLGPYKISLHSGSDKFSIYGLAAEATGGMLHLKTSGTSYLEAVRLAAEYSPALFREIYDVSREAYAGSRASYTVSADLDRTPLSRDVADADLVDLVMQSDSRQILHVGYGAVLTLEDENGTRRLDDELHALLDAEPERYAQALETYIGRHIAPLRPVV
ncbi:MAG: tagaturonate epimerase [Microbacteriaceae bacterium]|nr:tagaturonate epimerase [Microbacteriaceae bacterium]